MKNKMVSLGGHQQDSGTLSEIKKSKYKLGIFINGSIAMEDKSEIRSQIMLIILALPE